MTPQEPKTQQSEAQELNANAPADVKAAFDGGKILNEKAVDDAVRSGALESAFGGGIVQSKGRADIERFAKTMGKAGASVLSEQYRDGQDAEAYIRGMTKAYNAGKNGTSRAELINNLPSGIDGTQARSAYIAGQADATSTQAVKSPLPEAAQSGTMESAKAAPTLTVSDLAERLKTNTVTEDGAFRYSVERKGGRFPVYVGSIRKISGTDAYATDARAARYVSQNFKTYEEAVADLVAVARNSGFIKEDAYEQSRADGAGRSLRERGKEPDAAGNGTLPRASEKSMGETGHLRGRYERLTYEEDTALRSYKSSESYKINAKLRTGSPLTEAEQKMTAEMDAALEKLPKVDGKTYRTISFDDLTDSEAEYSAFLTNHQVGAPVRYKAYTSVSTAVDGHPLADGTKHGAILEIDGGNARSLDGISRNFEREALYPRNSTFIVRDIKTDKSGITHIYMEEAKRNGIIRPEGQLRSEERGGAVRDVQKAQAVHTDMQRVPERHTGRDTVRGQDLQGARKEVGPAENPQQQIADDVRRSIERGIAFSSARLFEIADKAYGGTMAQGAYTLFRPAT